MTKHPGSTLRGMDVPHYSYWQAIYNSFFNRALYVDVGKRWKGLSIAYLLLMIFVVSLPFSLRVMFVFDNFFQQGIITPLQNLPEIYVQNGLVSLDKPMPYFVRNDSGDVIAIVDTSGAITDFSTSYPQQSILITKDSFMFRVPNPPQFFKAFPATTWPATSKAFTKELNQVFDAKEWVQSSSIKFTRIAINAMIFPTIAALFFTMYLAFLLVFTLMAQFVAKILLKFDLGYMTAFRLLMVATTPQIVVLQLSLALDWIFSGLGMVLCILIAAYFSFAVLSLKRESNKLVRL